MLGFFYVNTIFFNPSYYLEKFNIIISLDFTDTSLNGVWILETTIINVSSIDR